MAVTTSPRPANTMKTCASPPAYFQCWDKQIKAMSICGRRRRSKPASIPICSTASSISRGPTGRKCFRSPRHGHLRFDIEPAAFKSKILAAIEKAGKPNIGGYGGDAFYSGLLNAGGGDFVVRDLARYRPMLEDNKANWESFGGARSEPRLDCLSGISFPEIHLRHSAHQRRICHV